MIVHRPIINVGTKVLPARCELSYDNPLQSCIIVKLL